MTALLALACLRTGVVLELFGEADGELDVDALAAVLPQLFGSVSAADWSALFERLGAGDESGGNDVILLGENAVHVVQRLARPPDTALVAVASGTTNVGLVMSLVRKKAAELEAR